MLAPPLRSTEKATKTDVAKKLLPALLAQGAQSQQYIMAVARALDIGESTINGAKKELGIKAYHVGSGADGQWLWVLPNQPDPSWEHDIAI
jgi:hypothetical protein